MPGCHEDFEVDVVLDPLLDALERLSVEIGLHLFGADQSGAKSTFFLVTPSIGL
jgi:hypothetical protein